MAYPCDSGWSNVGANVEVSEESDKHQCEGHEQVHEDLRIVTFDEQQLTRVSEHQHELDLVKDSQKVRNWKYTKGTESILIC